MDKKLLEHFVPDNDLMQHFVPDEPKESNNLLDSVASSAEAGVRGAADALTLGQAPKIMAALNTARAAVKGQIEPTLDALKQRYSDVKAVEEENFKKSKEDHPYANFAGEALGSIPYFTTLAGAGGALRLAGAGATLSGAKEGLNHVLEGDINTDAIKSTATEAAKGAGAALTGAALGKVASKLPELTGSAYDSIKGGLLKSLGISDSTFEMLKNNPELIENAPTLKKVLSKITDSSNKLSDNIASKSSEAEALLTATPKIPKSDIADIINKDLDALKRQGIYKSDASKSAGRYLEDLKSDLAHYDKGDTLSEESLNTLVSKLQDDINWNNSSTKDDLLKATEAKLNQYLKSQNPDYANKMSDIQNDILLSKDINKSFNLGQRAAGQPLEPKGDVSYSKVANVLGDNKQATLERLGQLEESTGIPVLNDIKASNAAEELNEKAFGPTGIYQNLGKSVLPFAAKTEKAIENSAKDGVLNKLLKVSKPLVSLGSEISKQGGLIGSTIADSKINPLSKRSPEELKAAAERLRSNQSTAKLGEALDKSMEDKNVVNKNAALFGIAQNPQAKKMLKGDDESKK